MRLHFLSYAPSSTPLEDSGVDPRRFFNRFCGRISSSLLDWGTALAVRFGHDPTTVGMMVGSMMLEMLGLEELMGRWIEEIEEIAALAGGEEVAY